MRVVVISTKQQRGLVIALTMLVCMTISIPSYVFNKHSSNLANKSGILTANSLSDSQEGPQMRFYLRRYTNDFGGNLLNSTLKILVEDDDGVDVVTMMYSQKSGDSENFTLFDQDIGVWQNVTMKHKSDSWYEVTIHISNLTEPYSWCSFLVRYIANDTLGNSQISPLCIYVFSTLSTVIADWFGIELYDTPDLWYVAGTTNHTVSWNVVPDSHGQSGWIYSLYEEGNLTERWRWRGKITIDVDGLDIGDHIFDLYLRVALSSKTKDTVTVHVVGTSEEIPSGAATGSVGPITETNEGTANPLTPVVVVGLFFIAAIVIWGKRKT
jgi:hypothetical protein